MKRTILFLLLTCILWSAPALAGSLRVVTLNSPPLAFEEKGEVKGVAAELVREGLRRMGVEAHITIMPWKRAVFMARFGEADAIFYAVRNPEREGWFHYPDEPLVTEATVVLRRKGTDVVLLPGRTDYSEYSLGVGRGYYYGPGLERFLEASTFARIEEATTFKLNLGKLIGGRIDAFLADLNLARHFLAKCPVDSLVEIVTDDNGRPIILDAVDSYLAFSRETVSPKLAEQFSKVLRDMKKDGTYDCITNSFK